VVPISECDGLPNSWRCVNIRLLRNERDPRQKLGRSERATSCHGLPHWCKNRHSLCDHCDVPPGAQPRPRRLSLSAIRRTRSGRLRPRAIQRPSSSRTGDSAPSGDGEENFGSRQKGKQNAVAFAHVRRDFAKLSLGVELSRSSLS
jgi:hypothetical protein